MKPHRLALLLQLLLLLLLSTHVLVQALMCVAPA
jgi:hypothetical protein